jgi:hypothetical protein
MNDLYTAFDVGHTVLFTESSEKSLPAVLEVRYVHLEGERTDQALVTSQ